MKKDQLATKWKEILDSKKESPNCSGWSASEETKLSELTSQPITMADTALGRHQAKIKKQLSSAVTKMSKEERDELKRKIDELEEAEEDEPLPLKSVMPRLERG